MDTQEINEILPQKVFCAERNLTLRVLGHKKGHLGEDRYLVCKVTATNPEMGMFSVRKDAVIEVN